MIEEMEEKRLRLLVQGLHLFGMDKEEALLVVQLMVGKPCEREQLMEWMANHPEATPDDISNMAIELVRPEIPKNTVTFCNKCELRTSFTATCPKYPKRIPDQVLTQKTPCKEFKQKKDK